MNSFNELPDTITLIVIIVYLVSLIGTSFYYLYFFLLAGRRRNVPLEGIIYPSVSVVICARNEADNLKKFLPLVLSQDYEEFEVIVVNDCSTDDTEETINAMSLEFKNLRYTFIKNQPKFSHNKKLALTIGIKAARHEHILLTDADCYPSSDQWIKSIASNYTGGKEIVLAYGAYETKPGFLNKLIRFETVFTTMQFMGFAERGLPFMGVGRNLSYHKSLFFRNKGFASHLDLISGDDDLFIEETANSVNTSVESRPESFTYSVPKSNLREWFRQRKRHFTTGSRYKNRTKLLLGLEYLFRICLLITFIWLLSLGFASLVAAILFIINQLIKAVVYKIILKRLNEKFLFLFSLIIESLIPYIYFIIHISNLIEKKKNQWN